MRPVRCTNQELGVDDSGVAFRDVPDCHRIHVVNQNLVEDVVVHNTEIAPEIPCYNVLSDLSPFSGSVKLLVDVSIESESLGTNVSGQSQVSKALQKGIESSKF